MQVVIFNMDFLMTRCIKTFLFNRKKRKLLFGDIIYGILVIPKMKHNASRRDDVAQLIKTRPGNQALFEYKSQFLNNRIKKRTSPKDMSVNYAAGLSPYADKGVCGLPEVLNE